MYEKFFRYDELEIGGWTERQLRVQADGLAGNLDRIWPDVKESRWLGGKRDGWERFPYFLDGFLPLAYLLKDQKLKSRADKYISVVKSLQTPEGKICPQEDKDEKNEDMWSMFLVIKVLVEYADFTGDEEIEEIVFRALKYLFRRICKKTLSNWAASRWYECLIPIIWLYERRPEKWLLTFARRLKLQGIDFSEAGDIWKDGTEDWSYEKHVVNIAMSLKAEALFCRLFGKEYTGRAERMLCKLDDGFGNAYGHFNGDECLPSENSPVRGSELCGIVEAMYSYELLMAQTGDAKWGDRLETLAFNGLPAALSGAMWAHQYDQQVNQIACVPFERNIFGTNGNESNLFGLEPHYGCCTANFGQGWPKFVRSAYMKTDKGIAVVSPLPMSIRTKAEGKEISLRCESEYPFRNTFRLICDGEYVLSLRRPAWAEIDIDVPAETKGGWSEIRIDGKTEITVRFECAPRLVERPKNLYCLKYGALLFALPVSYTEERVEYVRAGVERKYPYCDYVYRTAGPWEYAFAEKEHFEVELHDVGNPFDKKHAPVEIKCTVIPVKWGFKAGYKDIADDKVEALPAGPKERKAFWPYGATYLRMTELPEVCKNPRGENR